MHSRAYNVFFNRIDDCNWRRLPSQRNLCSDQENDARDESNGTSLGRGRFRDSRDNVLQRMLRMITATRKAGKALVPGLPFSLRLLLSVSSSAPKPSEGNFYCDGVGYLWCEPSNSPQKLTGAGPEGPHT